MEGRKPLYRNIPKSILAISPVKRFPPSSKRNSFFDLTHTYTYIHIIKNFTNPNYTTQKNKLKFKIFRELMNLILAKLTKPIITMLF